MNISHGTLVPAFDKDQTDYMVDVGFNVKNVTVTAEVYDDKADVQIIVKGIVYSDGSHSVNLDVGQNLIEISVTAEDGTVKTYTVTYGHSESGQSKLRSGRLQRRID